MPKCGRALVWRAYNVCTFPGSGKTLAFLLPLVIHAKQAALKGSEGVKALIVSPTRELAVQSAQVGLPCLAG